MLRVTSGVPSTIQRREILLQTSETSDTRISFRRKTPDAMEPSDSSLRCWKLQGKELLEPALSSGAIALLDAKWVVELSTNQLTIARRQDLPPEAFLTLQQIQANTHPNSMPVICLSYMWLHPDHPDPYGDTLRLVADVLCWISRTS